MKKKEIERITPINMTPERVRRCRKIPDLTNEQEVGPHAVNLVLGKIVGTLREIPGLSEPTVVREPREVTVKDSFDNLLIPAGAPARQPQYVRYLRGGKTLFRSHTTAMVPPFIREHRQEICEEPTLVVFPGITFRREVRDNTHTPEPHMADVWLFEPPGKSSAVETQEDLEGILTRIVQGVLPESRVSFADTNHPYTRQGVEISVETKTGNLEIGEAGLLNPEVLRINGITEDPKRYTGFASGWGLDRLVMAIKGIGDIRTLRATDSRIQEQMRDLEPYKPVSLYPPVKRKVSLIMRKDDLHIGKDGLEAANAAVTEMLSETDPKILGTVETLKIDKFFDVENLPSQALERTGAKIGCNQVQVLLDVSVRPLDRQATSEEANEVVNDIYKALNVTGVPLSRFVQDRLTLKTGHINTTKTGTTQKPTP
jgi:phenylalanyl-tRNA synthetase alpha chain